ncbi:MAG: DUF2333 family protein [Porticoccaceae bacterium]|jgi:hypothetical protein|nr:DUF2333 family protein [Porticoccaceae bacterium]
MKFFRGLRSRWSRSFNSMSETLSEDYVGERAPKGLRYSLFTALLLLLLVILLGWYWSDEPDLFKVTSINNQAEQAIVGTATTGTLVYVVDTMLNKPGGYMANDVIPPGLWLDNLPSWEFGVLVQVRDLSKALRESFSRSQSQSTEDRDLALAEPRFNVDHQSWAVPWPESEYADGRDYLKSYQQRLGDEQEFDAQFYARADNLRYWLGTVETRLGSLSQRLSASVGQRRINTDLAGATDARQSTASPRELVVKTDWMQIDNVFYEARGTAWALLHFLQAIEIDFADVLEKKNARASVRQIVRELEMTQQPVNAPIIVNGEGFGVLANHSLVMASYISRANAAIIDLRELLSQG